MSKTIAILAPSHVPFQRGGAEKAWWGWRDALSEYSDAAIELLKLPCPENSFAEIVSSYKKFSNLDLGHFDILITTKYPAWITPHPAHVCYMYHPLRGLYDSYYHTRLPETLAEIPSTLADLVKTIRKPAPTREDLAQVFELCTRALNTRSLSSSLFSFPGPLIRELVHFFDRVALAKGQIMAYLALSKTIAGRMNYFPENAEVKVLYHPSDLKTFMCEKGRYFFTASRLDCTKRIDLLIDAMRHCNADIPLRIAGGGDDEKRLRKLAENDKRIEFLGHVPDSAMSALYAGAIAVPFVPLNEDLGLVTIEAMKSSKPVITTTDSGGVQELVRDGETGFVVKPDASSLGHALQTLADNPLLAEKMGRNAYKSVAGITWQNSVNELLSYIDGFVRVKKTTILVLAPFEADATGAGGQRRLFHLCEKLTGKFAVRIVCYGDTMQRSPREHNLAPNMDQTTLPWPKPALDEARALAEETGACADDIALMRYCEKDELLAGVLKKYGQNVYCAVLSHPWLYKSLTACLPNVPFVYDAQDVEADLKLAILKNSVLADEAAAMEEKVCSKAKFVFPCSTQDLERLQDLYAIVRDKLILLPNGCDSEPVFLDRATLRKKLLYPEAKLVLFIGSGHKPNQEAALAIFEIASQLPDIQFLIAGSVSTQHLVRKVIRPQNAHLLGIISEPVKNILLQAADLAINPITSGSGVNLKSLEYLAWRLPCISTSKGMRGLPPDLEPAVRICQLEDFPAQIRSFFDSPPHYEEIEAISAKFRQENCWQNTLEPLVPAIASIGKDSKCAS